MAMDQSSIISYIRDTFDGVNVVTGSEGIAAGDTFFIYDPQRNLPDNKQMPFATIVTKDYGDFDNASNLNRPDVYRLNVGVGRTTFRTLFPDDSTAHDYTALDVLIPHPVYAAQSWVSVLNPGEETFKSLEPLLREAYELAVRRINPRR